MKNYIAALALTICCLHAHAKHDIPATSEFKVTGLVRNEIRFSIDDLSKYKQDSLGDLIVRNRKGEERGAAKRLKGILLKTILDSAGVIAEKPKDYASICFVLTASDGFINVYSWSEIFNTEIGNHVYIITEMDGQTISQIPDRILVLSLSDLNSGGRHLKGLAKIEVKSIR